MKGKVMTKRKVLIVGGGVAGLTLANALSQYCPDNVTYKIVERQQQFNPVGAGIALPANALCALNQIKLDTAISQKANQVKEIEFNYDSNQFLGSRPTCKLHTKGFPFLGVSRATLHENLLPKAINNKIQMGTTLVKLNQSKDKIIATLSDGSEDIYDLVVGADGIRSCVRKLSHDDVEEIPLSLGITNWRLLLKRSPTLEHPTYILGAGTLILLFPISDSQMYCYAGVLTPPNGISEEERKSIQFMKSHFEHIGKDVKFALDQIIDPNQLIPDQLETVREVKTYSKMMKNILFIGDAAHACAPTFQQGGAMSIEDAVIVAKLLAAFESLPIDQIIHFYDTFRFKTIQEVQTLSNFIIQRQVQTIEPQAIEARNQKIKQDGPFNVKFWQEYLKTDIFDELDNFIRTRLN
jgi:2-polyprenyl-6-methoxyphenol hydroxylase-like FAD-dependent oxidoreductase